MNFLEVQSQNSADARADSQVPAQQQQRARVSSIVLVSLGAMMLVACVAVKTTAPAALAGAARAASKSLRPAAAKDPTVQFQLGMLSPFGPKPMGSTRPRSRPPILPPLAAVTGTQTIAQGKPGPDFSRVTASGVSPLFAENDKLMDDTKSGRLGTMDAAELEGLDLGTAPLGPDPFDNQREHVQQIKSKIKGIIGGMLSASNAAIPKSAAKMGMMKSGDMDAFFQRPEKTWRPAASMLFFEALNKDHEDVITSQMNDALVVAEIVEILNIATQVHETVLEDADSLEKGNAAHTLYGSTSAGNKVSLLAGDFLLARASVLSASLHNTAVVESVASALQNLMEGQVQLHRPADLEGTTFNSYILSTKRRGGMLLARGCESIALMSGHSPDSQVVEDARQFGVNLGMAYQLLKDLQRTEDNYDKALVRFRKAKETDSRVGYSQEEKDASLQVAGPLMYAAVLFPELHELTSRGFKTEEELTHARDLIYRCDAVAAINRMATYHAALALESISGLPASEAKDALTLLVHYVVEEGQPHLMRNNYSPEGAFQLHSDSSGGGKRDAFKRGYTAAKTQLVKNSIKKSGESLLEDRSYTAAGMKTV